MVLGRSVIAGLWSASFFRSFRSLNRVSFPLDSETWAVSSFFFPHEDAVNYILLLPSSVVSGHNSMALLPKMLLVWRETFFFFFFFFIRLPEAESSSHLTSFEEIAFTERILYNASRKNPPPETLLPFNNRGHWLLSIFFHYICLATLSTSWL